MTEFYEILRQLWLVWFMGLFVGIVAWAYWPSRRQRLQSLGHIPLNDDPLFDEGAHAPGSR
ncbi:MAG TPA: cbb3-type cytochrome c oxidase subunit 3 [Azospirillaceae bacterium]|nr:cbb3-type cytochrome c oxidase subunit 3 [Azospirillaceae bacterium]